MRCLLLLAVLAGCASAGSPEMEDTTPRQATVLTGDKDGGTIYGERPRAVTMTIIAPPATVWLAAKKTYADFDIPLAVENPAAHQLGNPNFFKSRQLAGRAMVDWVDCGSGMTGPKAASYRIYMSLLTELVTDGKGGTKIQTTFVPAGQDMSGSSSDRIPCGSTGRFEQFFLDHVAKEVGRS
ncbi:MAG: hypothetical protein ACREPM_17500 [Gemmatimonadaceae bacterium]